jgi:hypothetical protein
LSPVGPKPTEFEIELIEQFRRDRARAVEWIGLEMRALRALTAMYEAQKAAPLPDPDPAALPIQYGVCEVCGVVIGASSRHCYAHCERPKRKPRRD